jgi:hypothetical protein
MEMQAAQKTMCWFELKKSQKESTPMIMIVKAIEEYPLEKRRVGAESGGRDVSVGRTKPESLAATITASGGLSAGNDNNLISIFSN